MSSADASMASAMSASFAWVTALSASVPLPSRRSLCDSRAPRRARAARSPSAAAPTVTRNRFSVSIADAEAFARLADDRVGGNADIVIFQAGKRVRRDDLDPLGDGQPDLGMDDEGRQAARALAFAGARKGHVEIGDPAVGNVGLLADQHPFIAVAHRGRGHVRRIRSAFRLGHCEGGDRFAARDLGQPFALLLDRSEQADRARSQALHREGEIGERVMIARASRARWRGCARRAACRRRQRRA